MERVRRRFWAWLVTAGAVLVIVAAAASGLFQIIVQAVPGYRDDVEQYVRDVTGRPVRIDALGLTWRYYYPSLELIGVALLAGDGRTVVLEAERLRLGFGLTRLVRGDFMPSRLELHGLVIDARIDSDGQVALKNVETTGSPDESVEALRPLTRFERVRLERCRLNVQDARQRGETFSFGIAYAQLDRGLLSDHLEAEVALPASIGDLARFEGAITGELLEPATWTGDGTLELTGLNVNRWLGPYLARGASLDVAGVEARLRGQLRQGVLKQVEAWVLTGPARGQRARHEAAFEALEAGVAIEFLDDGWNAELRKLTLETALGRWPATQGTLRALQLEDQPIILDAQLGYLRIADVVPWLPLLKAPPAVTGLSAARGIVRDAQLRYQERGDAADFSYRARFEDLALPAGERPVGFAGLVGEVAGDDSGGRAVLQEHPVTVELPGVLITPAIPVEVFEGEVEWRRRDRGWQVGLPQFRWELWTTRGRGRLTLLLPEDGDAAPEIDLVAQFEAADATRAKPLMPLAWSTGLRNWLDTSIVSGSAPSGELTIRGPLDRFPFDGDNGVFALDIEARDVLLAYHPDWPVVEDVDAKLEFRGSSLAIEASRGTVHGNPIRRASARFPDFRTGQLLVAGTVTGETARYYDFLAKSPLRELFRGLLKQTVARGPAVVDIELDIPVAQATATKVSGRVALDGVELRVNALDEPIRDVRGEVVFGPAGIRAQRLTAKLYELSIEGALVPRSPTRTLLSAGWHLTLDPGGQGASALVPAWLRKRVSGTSAWSAELEIGGEQAAPLKLHSDLVGVQVRFPAPLGKPAEQAQPVTLAIGSQPKVPLQITVEYGERFGADLHFGKGSAAPLQRGTLRLGAGPSPPPQEPGLVIAGRVDELDVVAWQAELKGAGVDDAIGVVRRAELDVGRAIWDRYAIRDARYQWTAQKGGWTLAASGPGASGQVQWNAAGRGTLLARLEHAVLDYAAAVGDDDAAGDAAADPTALPVFDLDVGRLVLNAIDLGHVTFATTRTELGQRVRALKAEGATLTLTVDGEWRRRAGQSSATLNADGSTTAIAALLVAFGYTPNLDARVVRARTALTWEPSDRGIEWQQAQGTVHLEFENGQLRALEPGAGRVLGLFNFYALPRRLTLNFRDVLGSGLAYDRISGDFELRHGNARTHNLTISGPSLRMDVTGRIGLAARDYDQQVVVYPDVSGGVTLGAVLLGGPIAGVLTWIAQELMNKPLNQVTQLSYRVTGSWDNPQVERATAPPPAPAANAPRR